MHLPREMSPQPSEIITALVQASAANGKQNSLQCSLCRQADVRKKRASAKSEKNEKDVRGQRGDQWPAQI